MRTGRPGIVAVVGPTAVGKSDLAVALAQRLGGEVVNADAMQVYRGMDIGTAKLTPADRGGVVHHLLDVLDVTETATVAEFQVLARAALADCLDRGVTPVLVGGSPLYVRAVLDRFTFPGTDPAVRAGLEAELAAAGPEPLHRRLAQVDPTAAANILASNGRRLVRALEVVQLTGRPFSAALPTHVYAHEPTTTIGLEVSREVLDARIEARVDLMWRRGLVDEVRRLEAQGLRDGRTAARALGYAQVLAFLAGRGTEQQARDGTAQATRRFARRQLSWWRKDPRIGWLAADPDAGADDLVDRALARLGGAAGSDV